MLSVVNSNGQLWSFPEEFKNKIAPFELRWTFKLLRVETQSHLKADKQIMLGWVLSMEVKTQRQVSSVSNKAVFFLGGGLFLVCRLDVFLRCSNVIQQGHWDWRRMKRFKGSLKNRSGVHDCCWNAEGEGGGRFRFWYRCSVIGWMQKAWGEKGSFLNALWWCPAENAELGLGEGWTVNTTLV